MSSSNCFFRKNYGFKSSHKYSVCEFSILLLLSIKKGHPKSNSQGKSNLQQFIDFLTCLRLMEYLKDRVHINHVVVTFFSTIFNMEILD